MDPDTGNRCKTNEPGEIWYRSPLNMKGYLNNPEATHRTLTKDGWLKTGKDSVLLYHEINARTGIR